MKNYSKKINAYMSTFEFNSSIDDPTINIQARRRQFWKGQREMINLHLNEYQMISLVENFRKHLDHKIRLATHMKQSFLNKATGQEE